jgi:hypothetical protein
MNDQQLPLGFGMALAQNPDAMRRFTALNESEQASILQQAHSVRSKDEMRSLVSGLASDQSP